MRIRLPVSGRAEKVGSPCLRDSDELYHIFKNYITADNPIVVVIYLAINPSANSIIAASSDEKAAFLLKLAN